jgi:hypothetical protein
MTASEAMTRRAPAAGGAPARAEQLYVTHCARGDSVQGQEGFGPRACSSSDPALLRLALELPAHELPVGMWSLNVTAAQAPRRLARVELPNGRVALVHSSYLPLDTRGRDGNYFTHVLVYDRLSPREAIRTWASPRWQTDYLPGAPKELPPFEGLPPGSAIHDGALAAFLNPATASPVESALATAVFTERVRTAGDRRRDWLRLTLAAALRALAESEPGRSRVYLHAEPGVTALLVYGLARLLPEALVARLSFSTYESPGASLRECKYARVIGTWTGQPDRPLEADALRRNGYVIDLTREPAPDEVPPAADQLVALAAAGDWEAVEELHALAARSSAGPVEALDEAAAVRPIYRRVKTGPLAPADLAALARSPLGEALLEEMAPAAWPLVWRHCLEEEAARRDFLNILRRRRDELEANVCRAILEGDSPPWPRQWALLRAVLSPADAAARFRSILARARGGGWRRFPPAARLALLREWQTTEPDLAFLPAQEAELLATTGEAELAELAKSELPNRWLGQAWCLALADSARAPEVAALLQSAETLRGFCEAVRGLHAATADELLAPLLPPRKQAGVDLFARLEAAGLTLDPPVLERLLARAHAAEGRWLRHWLQGDNLARLGGALPSGSSLLAAIWKRYTASITEAYLSGHREQQALVERLEAAREARTPAEAAVALDGWRRRRAEIDGTAAPREETGGRSPTWVWLLGALLVGGIGGLFVGWLVFRG